LSLSINNNSMTHFHFVGILGSGMSALAQYLCWLKCTVSGSDRNAAGPGTADVKKKLEELGCTVAVQDGRGITSETECVIISTAIEDSNPDLQKARTLSIPVIHRSDLLATIIESRKTIAIAGTSGKSTVTALCFDFLTYCGKSPSLLSGAAVQSLIDKGMIGNAWKGSGDLLVIEADESDGTLVKYTPDTTTVLNISKDHKPVSELQKLFSEICAHSRTTIVNGSDSKCKVLKASATFSTSPGSTYSPDRVLSVAPEIVFEFDQQRFRSHLLGDYNLENIMAAIAVCKIYSCKTEALSKALHHYRGLARRFNIYPSSNGIKVIDDFAHNPEKIKAALSAAQLLSPIVHAVFQPHGFGPTRFFKDELIAMFSNTLRDSDFIHFLPIYYAGGTASKDISSDEIVQGIAVAPGHAVNHRDRESLLTCLRNQVGANSVVLVMGARDPSLTSFIRQISEELKT